MIKRYFDFILKEKTQNFVAFLYYLSIIVFMLGINLPTELDIAWIIFVVGTMPFVIPIYIVEAFEKTVDKSSKKKTGLHKRRIKKILTEILLCIPVILISICINTFIIVGKPANQISIEQSFKEALIWELISCIVIAPIIEEFIFRFLPARFIKNKIIYIIVSAVVFAAAHVANDSNPFYYIWAYMIKSLYYGYRYYKTKDIWVTISLHSFSNIIATIIILL